MKVILLKSVPKVGKTGDVVDVSDGYAANALFPNKSAILATQKNLDALNKKKQSEADLKAFQHGLLEQAIHSLPDMKIQIPMRANENGHLFSKVDESGIVKALSQHRVSIGVKNIVLKEPIKELGMYTVTVKEGDYKTDITVEVIRE